MSTRPSANPAFQGGAHREHTQTAPQSGGKNSSESERYTPVKRDIAITLRTPTAEDGAGLHRLVAACPPLDPNSLYCNLLHCTHFSGTSVAAVYRDDQGAEQLAGFISGYIPPGQPDTLFVWQVAVAQEARGQHLAARMLDSILQRPACSDIRYIDTTITPGNRASWGLFESWARQHGAATSSKVHFERERHFDGRHHDEHLMRIGPFEMAAESAT